MELRKKIRWSRGVGHHSDRPIVLAGQHIHQIDPARRDVGPRPAGRDRRGLSCSTVTDGKLVRTLKATAKVLTILCIVNPTTKWVAASGLRAPNSGCKPVRQERSEIWRPSPTEPAVFERACRMAFRPAWWPKDGTHDFLLA